MLSLLICGLWHTFSGTPIGFVLGVLLEMLVWQANLDTCRGQPWCKRKVAYLLFYRPKCQIYTRPDQGISIYNIGCQLDSIKDNMFIWDAAIFFAPLRRLKSLPQHGANTSPPFGLSKMIAWPVPKLGWSGLGGWKVGRCSDLLPRRSTYAWMRSIFQTSPTTTTLPRSSAKLLENHENYINYTEVEVDVLQCAQLFGLEAFLDVPENCGYSMIPSYCWTL